MCSYVITRTTKVVTIIRRDTLPVITCYYTLLYKKHSEIVGKNGASGTMRDKYRSTLPQQHPFDYIVTRVSSHYLRCKRQLLFSQVVVMLR